MAILFSCANENLFFHHSEDLHADPASFQMHVHEMYEIYYFASGDVKYTVEGKSYTPEPGSILIMCSAETHRAIVSPDVPYERCALHFSPAIVKETFGDSAVLAPFTERPLGQMNYYRPSEFDGIKPSEIFPMIYESSPLSDDYRIKTGLFSLLAILAKAFEKKTKIMQTDSKGMVNDIISYINRNLYSDLSLTSISRELHISLSLLCSVFKQATGSTVGNYIRSKRIIAAHQLIESGMSVQDASMTCGFGDYSSFYRAYVKFFHTSPKARRTKNMPPKMQNPVETAD